MLLGWEACTNSTVRLIMNKPMQLLPRAKKQRKILGIGDMATLDCGTCKSWSRKIWLMTLISKRQEKPLSANRGWKENTTEVGSQLTEASDQVNAWAVV